MCSTTYSTCTYSKKLQVAYNDAFRILLKLPRQISANQMFVMTFHAMLRNFMQKFRCWLINSENVVIIFLTVPTLGNTRYSSYFWKHWNICLIITDDCLFVVVVVVFSCFSFSFTLKMDYDVWNNVLVQQVLAQQSVLPTTSALFISICSSFTGNVNNARFKLHWALQNEQLCIKMCQRAFSYYINWSLREIAAFKLQ